jgi:hypothetical protein
VIQTAIGLNPTRPAPQVVQWGVDPPAVFLLRCQNMDRLDHKKHVTGHQLWQWIICHCRGEEPECSGVGVGRFVGLEKTPETISTSGILLVGHATITFGARVVSAK